MKKNKIRFVARNEHDIEELGVETSLSIDVLGCMLYEDFSSFGENEDAKCFLNRLFDKISSFAQKVSIENEHCSDYNLLFDQRENAWNISEAIIKGDESEENLFSLYIDLKKYLELIEAKSDDFEISPRFFAWEIFKKTLDEKGIFYGELTSDFALPILSHSGEVLGHIDVPDFSEDSFIASMKGDNKTFLREIGSDLEIAVIEAMSICKKYEHFLAVERNYFSNNEEVLVPALLPAEDKMCYGYNNFVSGINLFPPMKGDCVTVLNTISVDVDCINTYIEGYDELIARLEDEAPCISVGCFDSVVWNIVPRYYLGEFNLYYVKSPTWFEKVNDATSLEDFYSRSIAFASKTSYYFTNTDNALKKSEEKAMEIIHGYIADMKKQCC